MFQNSIQNVKKSALLIVPTSRYWKGKLPCTDQLVENLRTEVCWLRRALYRRSSSDLVTANHGAPCWAKTHTLLSRNHSWHISSEKIGFTFLTPPEIFFWLKLSSSDMRECIFAIWAFSSLSVRPFRVPTKI